MFAKHSLLYYCRNFVCCPPIFKNSLSDRLQRNLQNEVYNNNNNECYYYQDYAKTKRNVKLK